MGAGLSHGGQMAEAGGGVRLSRWTPRSLGRMGQVRAGCQEGEAGGCEFVWGGGGQ